MKKLSARISVGFRIFFLDTYDGIVCALFTRPVNYFSLLMYLPINNIISKESAGMVVQERLCYSGTPVHGAVCSAP